MSTTTTPRQRIANAKAVIQHVAGPASIGRASAMDNVRLGQAKSDLVKAGWSVASVHRFQNRTVMAFRHNQVRMEVGA